MEALASPVRNGRVRPLLLVARTHTLPGCMALHFWYAPPSPTQPPPTQRTIHARATGARAAKNQPSQSQSQSKPARARGCSSLRASERRRRSIHRFGGSRIDPAGHQSIGGHFYPPVRSRPPAGKARARWQQPSGAGARRRSSCGPAVRTHLVPVLCMFLWLLGRTTACLPAWGAPFL